jgi:HSP20 family protein
MNQTSMQPDWGGQAQQNGAGHMGGNFDNTSCMRSPENSQMGSGSQAQAVAGAELQPATVPPVDIFEDESGITVLADLPGVSRERLNIKVTGDNLSIEGMAQVPETGVIELIYGEVQSPVYRRQFTLSRELDPGKIEAKLSDGVLRLHIPKSEAAKPRRITVSVG